MQELKDVKEGKKWSLKEVKKEKKVMENKGMCGGRKEGRKSRRALEEK